MNVTHQQIKVLEALACFQYLTAQQMADAGVSVSAKAVRNKSLPRLKNHHQHFIGAESFGVLPTKGRLPDIYYLTKNGVELLAEALGIEPTGISYPIGGVQFHRDYFHRVAFIDFHISFRRWAESNGKNIEFFNSYFEMIGSQRKGHVKSQSVNRFRLKKMIYTQNRKFTFIPDGITRYQDGDKSRLVAIEIHNGVHSQRITEQLLDHTEAMHQGLINKKFGHDKASHIVSVHENQATLDSVRKRLMDVAAFQPFLRFFHFNLQSQVKMNLETGWTLADESRSGLFSSENLTHNCLL